MRTAVFRSKQTPGRTITRSRADEPLRGIEHDTSNIHTPIFVFTMAEVMDLLASRMSALVRRELGSVLKRSDHIPELLLTGPLPSLGSVRRSSECKRLDSNYFVWLRFHLFAGLPSEFGKQKSMAETNQRGCCFKCTLSTDADWSSPDPPAS